MEDVWLTVLRDYIVHIDSVDTPWPDLSGFEYVASPQSTHTTQPVPPSPSSAQDEEPEGSISNNPGPKTVEESVPEMVKVLAELLEAGADLMPAALLDRVGNLSLLSDKRLC